MKREKKKKANKEETRRAALSNHIWHWLVFPTIDGYIFVTTRHDGDFPLFHFFVNLYALLSTNKIKAKCISQNQRALATY